MWVSAAGVPGHAALHTTATHSHLSHIPIQTLRKAIAIAQQYCFGKQHKNPFVHQFVIMLLFLIMCAKNKEAKSWLDSICYQMGTCSAG